MKVTCVGRTQTSTLAELKAQGPYKAVDARPTSHPNGGARTLLLPMGDCAPVTIVSSKMLYSESKTNKLTSRCAYDSSTICHNPRGNRSPI